MGNLFRGGVILAENSAPVAPASDRALIHASDAGGKTELDVLDSSSAGGRIFLDSYFVAQNTTGSTIPKGSAVRVSGQSASRIPLIALADADALATMPAAGVTMESIANNGYGRVMVQGVLRALSTTGLTAGAPAYVSGTAGGITATAPVYPALRQVLGSVMSVHGSTGEIFVNVAHFFRQVGTPIVLPFFYGSTLTVFTGVGRFPITTNMVGTITEVRAHVNTAPTGASVLVAFRKNGAAAFSTVTISASATSGANTGLSTAVALNDYITVDITQIGSTVAGSDLTAVAELMTAA